MKRWMMLAALAASSVGCVAAQGDAPVRLLDARALTTGTGGACGIGTTQLPAGVLDISAGNSYLLGLRVETNTGVPTTSIQGRVLGGGGMNDFVLQEVVLSYEATGIAMPAEERIPIYGVFRPATPAEAGSYAILYALGPKAIEVLSESVGLDEEVTVMSTLKLVGRFSSGQTRQTNEVTYPITVIRSANEDGTCPAPKVPATSAWPCDNVGQDGAVCRRPAASPQP